LMTNGDTSSRPISGAGWKPKRVSTPGSPFKVGTGSEAGDAGRASTTLLGASAASGCASMSHVFGCCNRCKYNVGREEPSTTQLRRCKQCHEGMDAFFLILG
jgi:hypothetical protein